MEDITINDLYLKYTDGISEALEDDRYFQYLFEIVQAGNNTLQQKHRILHKVVDEQWLSVVEEGLTAIFNIVDKPRRFITTSEEVVPVALAKKDYSGQCAPLKPEHTVYCGKRKGRDPADEDFKCDDGGKL